MRERGTREPGPVAPNGTVGSEDAVAAVGRRPLLSWARPTRGYVACASIVATVGLIAIAGWQVWLVAHNEAPRWGWSVASVSCSLAAAGVVVELARRPRPQAYRARAGRPEPRAGDARERRLVRRAIWTATPPRERRLALVAASRLTAMAGNWVMPAVYLFGASIFAGLAATSVRAAYASGVVWAFGAPLLLALSLRARRQAGRLEQAWQDGRRLT